MTDAITEFLYGLSWKVDDQSQRKFLDGIETVSRRVTEMALAWEAAASIMFASVLRMSTQMEGVYWIAERTNSTVSQLRAYQQAAQNVGLHAEGMTATIDSFSRTLREMPNGREYLKSFGVQLDSNGRPKTDPELLSELVEKTVYMPFSEQVLRLKVFGIGDAALLALRDPQFRKELDEAYEKMRKAGIDPNSRTGQGYIAFMKAWRGLNATLTNITQRAGEGITGAAGERLEHFTRWLDAHAKGIADGLAAIGRGLLAVTDGLIQLIETSPEWMPVLEKLIENFKAWARAIDDTVRATIGWETALKLLLVLILGSQIKAAVGALAALVAGFLALLAIFGIKPAVAATPPSGAGEDVAKQNAELRDRTGSPAGGGGGRGIGGIYGRVRAAVARTFGGGGGKVSDDYKAVGGGAGLKEVIDREAKRAGVDPRIMYGIFAGEGLTGYVGDRGTSFGPYQLHYKSNVPGMTSAGLGDQFTRDTGLDARDRGTVAAQTKWVANFIARGGSLSHWHGYRGMREWQPGWSRRDTAGAVATSPGDPPGPSKEGVTAAPPPMQMPSPGSKFFDLHGALAPTSHLGSDTWSRTIENVGTERRLHIDVTGAQDPEATANLVGKHVRQDHDDMVNTTRSKIGGMVGVRAGRRE